MTWTNGRKLASVSLNELMATFTYDGEGNRIRKVGKNGTVDYIVIGGTIYGEIRTVNGTTTTLHYLFDETGTRIGFVVDGDDTYYYRFNLQGDVTGIYNASGTLITEYFYDAWGKLEKTTGNYFIGLLNPIRYRGYYFDMETGLYYLNTRYYDPEIGRFINSDVLLSTHKKSLISNIFVYCLNNPVNCIDSDGEDAVWLLDEDGANEFGHVGLLIQDNDGKWYHFWWGSTNGKYIYNFEVTKPKVKYVEGIEGELSLDELNGILNEEKVYLKNYEKATYFKGDFTPTLEYVQNYKGCYNLTSNNCMQLSAKALLQSKNCLPVEFVIALRISMLVVIPKIANAVVEITNLLKVS